MKIEDNAFTNFFKCFNEAQGVATAKSLVLKKKNPKVTTYLQNVVLIFLYILLVSLYLLVFKRIFLFSLVLFADLVFLFLNIFYMIERCLSTDKPRGTTTINKNGLVNNSYKKIEMHFSWDLVEAVVIKKNSITFLTKTPCFFFFDIANKKEIKELLKKYHKEDLLIEERK